MSVAELQPISKPVRVTEPTIAQEPVTLEEVKHQCGLPVSVAHHDDLLQSLTTAARQQVEHDTGLVCYTGSFSYKLTDWGSDWFPLPGIRPITSATIAYLDSDGTSQALATTVYAVETDAVQPFIRLKYGQSWPAIRGDMNGITITFVAGYATVLAIPRRVKQAVLLLVNHWYENRGVLSVGTISPELGMSYNALIEGLARRTYP